MLTQKEVNGLIEVVKEHLIPLQEEINKIKAELEATVNKVETPKRTPRGKPSTKGEDS